MRLLNQALLSKNKLTKLVIALTRENKFLAEQNETLREQNEAFRKYDAQRKEYYKFLVEDYQNSGAQGVIDDLQEHTRNQKKYIEELTDKYLALKNIGKYSDDDIAYITKTYRQFLKALSLVKLKERCDKLRDDNKNLVEKIVKLQQQVDQHRSSS